MGLRMNTVVCDKQQAYTKIVSTKIQYGIYHKTLFHVHTPQSYDYTLKKDWNNEMYESKSENDLLSMCYEQNILPNSFEIETYELEGELSVYSNKKEWLAFVMLAYTLINQEIEIVVVSDHNTIEGIRKLRIAIKHLNKMIPRKVYPEVIAGVEISYADKIHMVGIFDDTERNTKEINQWFDENLLSESDGTFKTSLDVIEFFDRIGAMVYIAHINSSDIFKDAKYLSRGYRKTLFSNQCLKFFGITGIEHQEKIRQYLSLYGLNGTCFVLDNDSHNIDEINKNYFWIKGSKRNYQTLEEALCDFQVSIAYTNNETTKKYIKGIYISGSGFLKDKDKSSDFVLRFSDALNCFVGGRGTGKSTVLQMIDYALSQRVESAVALDFICAHGNMWVLYADGNKEYLIQILLPYKENEEDNILRFFGQNTNNRFNYKYYFMLSDIKSYALKNYLSIYEVIKKNDKVSFEAVSYKGRVLEAFYDTRYSINDLVKTASGSEINDFIRDLLFKNKVLSKPEDVITARKKSGLVKTLTDIDGILKKRAQEVKDVLNPFNEAQKGILEIKYSQSEIPVEPDIEKWLFARSAKNKYFENYNVTEESVVDYVLNIYDRIGILALLKLALEEDNRKNRYIYSLLSFATEYSVKLVEDSITKLTDSNEKDVIDLVFDKLVTNVNIVDILVYLKTTIRQSECFSLNFNINSNESSTKKAEYKNVLQLSLGQKVVAMLDLILGYGQYIDDYRPILIDQPEDNLDSQYIYKNLVYQLREVKKNRQVIIATHNATIVTNAMADQVCVMQSDGTNGWVEMTGYPSEKRIKKSIINYMEGGIDSFRHKSQIYRTVIEKSE